MKISETINSKGDIQHEYVKWATTVSKIFEDNKIMKKTRTVWKVNRLLLNKIKRLKKEKRRERGKRQGAACER